MFLCGLRTHSRTHFYTQCIAITLMRSLLSAFCAALLWSPCNRSWPFSQSGECYDGALLTFAQCSFSKAEMSLARSQASRSSFNALASACLRSAGGGNPWAIRLASISNLSTLCSLFDRQPGIYFTLSCARMKWKCGTEVLIERKNREEKNMEFVMTKSIVLPGISWESLPPVMEFFFFYQGPHSYSAGWELAGGLGCSSWIKWKMRRLTILFWTGQSRHTVWWQSHRGTDEQKTNILIGRWYQGLCIYCR